MKAKKRLPVSAYNESLVILCMLITRGALRGDMFGEAMEKGRDWEKPPLLPSLFPRGGFAWPAAL